MFVPDSLTRRQLIAASGAAFAASRLKAGADLGVPAHRLPENESQYKRVKEYIEETPVPEYHWASSQAYEAFQDVKYGVRIHWGIYSIHRLYPESWPFLKMSSAERKEYNELYKTWNPSGFDASEWTSLFHEGGLKMLAFTTKHHEGFSMYHTKTRVKSRINWGAQGGPKLEDCDLAYSIEETPFRRDIVGEICKAAQARGLRIALYFSHPDWYDADFRPYCYHPAQVPSSPKLIDLDDAKKRLGNNYIEVADPTPATVQRMMARHRAQLTELVNNYGRIDMLSLDMWLGPHVWPQMRDTILHLRQLQPDVMLRARGIGNYGDYYTPERFVPGGKENTTVPWMVIYPLASAFSYDPDPKAYKGAGWIVSNLLDSVAKGGNFQVGIGPDGTGKFHPEAIRQLKEVGGWLKVNGEGVYGTRARDGALWSEGNDIRFSRTKDRRSIYAFALTWPGKQLTLKSVRANEGSKITMLGTRDPLHWRNDPQHGLVIDLPENVQDESKRPCQFAWGFQISGTDRT
jgi:alpha-L-fucosidase